MNATVYLTASQAADGDITFPLLRNSGKRIGFRRRHHLIKIALGAAQFGFDYGVANTAGKVTLGNAGEILQKAQKAGIDTLDTAATYGASEETLGILGVQGWKVISKLPAMPISLNKPEEWVIKQVRSSLSKVRIPQLDGLLLHKPSDLLGCHRDSYVGALRRIKDDGLARSVGYSIYSPNELEALLKAFTPDIVQAPLNIFDRRLLTSGWLKRLADLGIRVHARSALLQGLLVMPERSRPVWFDRWRPTWQAWSSACKKLKSNPLELALGYVLSHETIERVVVGVDSAVHLKQVIEASARPFQGPFPQICSNDLELIEPYRWVLD